MYLVTGGAGFIGSALVHTLVRRSVPVVNVDKLTYAANPASLSDLSGAPCYHFEQVDICDAVALRRIFERYRPEAVLHLAAESHVDRSIDAPADFVRTNVVGTFTLLSEARRHWESLPDEAAQRFRFVHVSTDEVFGSLGTTGRFTEDSAYDPTSPYSASKAGADHLVRAWYRTYGLPVVITNASNNFGPRQFPEKLIPRTIVSALAHGPLDVYGAGQNVRDWLYVEDHVDALLAVLERGRVAETYAIGGGNERTNLEVVTAVCDLIDVATDGRSGRVPRRQSIRFVEDRPGHDYRYAVDPRKIRSELGWQPRHSFESALAATVRWYIDHRAWWEGLLERGHAGQRLGLGGRA
jgi:dTDP-glucose 4,6-dehydratase